MQARVDYVLTIFATQVIKQKRPVWPVFLYYLAVSYDYVEINHGTYAYPNMRIVINCNAKLRCCKMKHVLR